MVKSKWILLAAIAVVLIAVIAVVLLLLFKTENSIPHGELPTYEGGEPGETIEGNDGQVTILMENTTEKEFLAYLKKLKSNKWKKYSTNTVATDSGNNLFATYTKADNSTVYAYYIAAENRAHILQLPLDALLETRAKDNAYKKICEPLFTQVQNKYDRASEGMSYLVRLSDGRFIVIDGGQAEAANFESDQLYALMTKQNKRETITIAAWIFTHPHGDHISAATEFLNRFADADVMVEQILYNFEKGTRAQGLSSAIEKWKEKGTQVVTPHTGQVYHFADAKIEILHTVEDFYPLSTRDLTENQTNNTSVAFHIRMAGQTILILGDMGETGSDEMVEMWGSYLKSDIMQMAHHGLPGGTVELYNTVDPTVVVMPTMGFCHTKYFNEFRYFQKDTTRAGQAFWWLYDNKAEQYPFGSGNVKEVIISGFGVRTLQLPYTPAEDTPYFSNRNQNGYRETEPEENPSVLVPQPLMDLQFADGDIANSGKGNVSAQNRSGEVGKYTVMYRGNAVEVNAFRATPYSPARITATLEDITSPQAFGTLVNTNGITFELGIALDNLPDEPTYPYTLFGSNGVGGLAMTLENPTLNVHFTMTDTQKNTVDAMPTAVDHNWNSNIVGGNVVQYFTATYNPTTKELVLYQNGVAVGRQTMEQDFLPLSDDGYNTLGIGFNAAKGGKALGVLTGYTVVTARMYDTCLTPEQVATSYFNTTTTLLDNIK